MIVDSTIVAIFGPAPDNIDLSAETAAAYNIACVVFFFVAVASVIVRFYLRIRGASLWWDDYSIVVGLVCIARTSPLRRRVFTGIAPC